MNDTVTFDSDFQAFSQQCAKQRRQFADSKMPTFLDTVWNPGDIFQRVVQEGMRSKQPGVTATITSMIEAGGKKALQLILAPSVARNKSS